MQITAFEGNATFEVLPHPTMREDVIRRAMVVGIPECRTFSNDWLILFGNLVLILGRVKSITFKEDSETTEIAALRQFWEVAHNNTDYRAVWEAYLDLPGVGINDALMKDVINAAIEQENGLRAPLEVRPGTPEDEVLEQMGVAAEPFLAPAVTTSTP